MPLKFYFDLMSQPCRALYILLKATNVPFEKCLVNLAAGERFCLLFPATIFYCTLLGQHYSDEYKQNVSRFGKVPVVHDGDFKLTERLFCFFLNTNDNKNNFVVVVALQLLDI